MKWRVYYLPTHEYIDLLSFLSLIIMIKENENESKENNSKTLRPDKGFYIETDTIGGSDGLLIREV